MVIPETTNIDSLDICGICGNSAPIAATLIPMAAASNHGAISVINRSRGDNWTIRDGNRIATAARTLSPAIRERPTVSGPRKLKDTRTMIMDARPITNDSRLKTGRPFAELAV